MTQQSTGALSGGNPARAGADAGPGRKTAQIAITAATITAGLVVVYWPLPWAAGWAYPAAALGTVAVLAAAVGRWRRAATVATAAAIGECAVSRLGGAGVAAEGLLILAYLVLADAPAGLPGSDAVRWVRRQAPLGLAGLVAAGVLLGALALRPAPSVLVVLIGLAAAVVAYFAALPRDRGGGNGPDGPGETDDGGRG